MILDVPIEAKQISYKLNCDVYIVGGWVRDAILGMENKDLDIVSERFPDEVKAVFGNNADIINRKLGTVKIRFGSCEFEHTVFRKDNYPNSGAHSPESVELGVSLEEDARRRDFSVNALYCNVNTGEVLDPINKGLDDIEKMHLRTTSDNPDAILKDDGLRIMRMVRMFAAKGFIPDKALVKSAKTHVKLLEDIAPERIAKELCMILMRHPRGIKLLSAIGALTEILPEMRECEGFRQLKQGRKYTVLAHNVSVCAYAPPVLNIKLAALMHDIGKPKCKNEQGNFRQHHEYSAEIAEKALKRLKFSNDITEKVVTLIKHHMFNAKNDASDDEIKLKILEMGEEAFIQHIELRKADAWASGAVEAGMPVETAERELAIFKELKKNNIPLTLSNMNVSGRDLENIVKPGKEMGKVLNELLRKCVLGIIKNEKECLIREAKKISNDKI